MQHTATYCNTLQHAATRCNTLQHIWMGDATHMIDDESHIWIVCVFICVTFSTHTYVWHDRCNTLQHTATHSDDESQIWIAAMYMGWLRLVNTLKLYVSFAKEPYKKDDILQKRPIILRSLHKYIHSYELCVSHLWIDHVSRMNGSCVTYEWSCHTCVWVENVTHMNSCVFIHTCDRALLQKRHIILRCLLIDMNSCVFIHTCDMTMTSFTYAYVLCYIHTYVWHDHSYVWQDTFTYYSITLIPSCICVMLYYVNGACHTYEWIMSHLWTHAYARICVTFTHTLIHICEAILLREWIMSRAWIKAKCHT